ncbi:major facilitator superfamily domain-containing protein [Alternaria alternata]|nr:major facilitator superfamily domain-containing protein [Alternaria alternata]
MDFSAPFWRPNVCTSGLIPRPPKLIYVFLLIVFLELEESMQKAPTIRLLENAICSQYYYYEPNIGEIKESMCKTSLIQSRLAHIRGALSLFDAVPVILLGSFYGSLADRKGRRGPFALAVFGIICQMACIYVVCQKWEQLPIEAVWVSSVFRLIGGGPNMAIALCLTMASDLSTDDTRSKSFYRVFTASLITDMVSPTIAFATLRHSLWLPYLVCSISLLCTFPVLLWMPETQPSTKESASLENGEVDSKWLSAYIRILQDWRISIALVTVFLAQFRQNTLEILLPYASVRFDMELGKTATLLSVVSAVNIVVFLVLLPMVTNYLQERRRVTSHRVNIWVARTSSATLAIGAAILATAPNIGLVVFALIIYATGFGVRLSILAVVTAFVSSNQETGRLYTMVATTDAVAHMIASPLLQWIWGHALAIGGRWLVLPFLVLMCIFILAFGFSCLLQEPGTVNTDEDLLAEQEALLTE